jgi:hypothetical protein
MAYVIEYLGSFNLVPSRWREDDRIIAIEDRMTRQFLHWTQGRPTQTGSNGGLQSIGKTGKSRCHSYNREKLEH